MWYNVGMAKGRKLTPPNPMEMVQQGRKANERKRLRKALEQVVREHRDQLAILANE